MENKSHKAIIEIQPTGSFFETDREGFLINPASIEKIQEEYRPVIKDIIEAYKQHLGEHLQNIYIRGSVAKGQAVSGISDIDVFAYVDTKEELDLTWTKDTGRTIEEKYPFVCGVEFDIKPIENSTNSSNIILLNQSVCVFGEGLEVPKIKPGKETILHIPGFEKRLEWFRSFLETEENEEEIQKGCIWSMKNLLRLGCELTMERSGKYTRDLYPCYQIFSEYYPEKEAEMRKALHLALNPTTNKKELKEIANTLGKWLAEEAKKIL